MNSCVEQIFQYCNSVVSKDKAIEYRDADIHKE